MNKNEHYRDPHYTCDPDTTKVNCINKISLINCCLTSSEVSTVPAAIFMTKTSLQIIQDDGTMIGL